jgi:AcrR family transcriptional regulator
MAVAATRRRGAETSATRSALMDAVEALMREQGYAALSARSVAAKAGLKYQLVFYYFASMDELLLATYQRRTRRVLERTEAALASPCPLHALWKAASDPYDAALSIEYMAMSNHNQLIRGETVEFGERMRRLVVEQLAGRVGGGPNAEVFTPFAITAALTLMGGILGFEEAVGLRGGHAEIEAMMAWALQQLEPGAPR